MQLFIIPTPSKSEVVTLTQSAQVHQCVRVLRMKVGSECMLQWEDSSAMHRGLYAVIELSKKSVILQRIKPLETKIKTAIHKSIKNIAIALPNKRSKAELIIQKLSEIGVSKIIRFPAERSQYKTIPDKKLQRMKEIAKEATEQSWGWYCTQIEYLPTIADVCGIQGNLLLCDIKTENGKKKSDRQDEEHGLQTVLVGPEGGRGPQDYVVLRQYEYDTLDLGERVLRMETAAIIAGWKVMHI